MCQYFNMLAMHGHGRGTRLGTCLVQQQCVSCVVAFAVFVNADKCSVILLILLHWLCMGMDEARALVHVLCSNNVSHALWPLPYASMQINVLLYS